MPGAVSGDAYNHQLRAACFKGDAKGALKALRGSAHGWGCVTTSSGQPTEGAARLPSEYADGSGNTLLHFLCSGEPLGFGGHLLLSLAGGHSHDGGGGSRRSRHLWPSRHQRARAQLLCQLLQCQPRLALLAGRRNAAGQTPLHCAVLSQSCQVLSVLLAALRQLLLLPAPPPSSGGRQERQHQRVVAEAAEAAAAALQLLLSVPNSEGQTPLELALQQHQWPAARLLAGAAGGGLPLSQPQMAACSLVQSLLARGGGRGGMFSSGGVSGGDGGADAGASGVHVSASGSAVADALGGLLSKLWDAFGSSSAAAAEAEEAEKQQLREQQDQQRCAAGEPGSSASGATRRQQQRCVPLLLQPRALKQADVVALVVEAEQQALAAAATNAKVAAAAEAAAVNKAAAAAAAGAAAAKEAAAAIEAEAADITAAEGAAAVNTESGTPDGSISAPSSVSPPLPSTPAATTAAAAAASAPAAANTASSSLGQCIVCYEEYPPGWLSVRLPCGHVTCDDCWRGILQAAIDEGDPQRAMCPQPGCGAPLPSPAAPRLLPPPRLHRFQQLLAQRYLVAHPKTMRCCPLPACGATLQLAALSAAAAAASTPAAAGPAAADGVAAPMLPAAATTGVKASAAAPTPPQGAFGAAAISGAAAVAAAEAAAAAEATAAAEAGLNAECGACRHRFCWRCGEEAHEPASCDQMKAWGEELAVLRRAAPNADREWLSTNTRRCPQCKAHIQKLGGCNHMRCGGCGQHFCWICGREWSQHSAETGGFYYCSLEQRDDLPEYSTGGSGGGSSLAGPIAWMTGVWGSIKAAAQQQQLQGQLRQFLRHSGGTVALGAAAAHMQLLLAAAGMLEDDMYYTPSSGSDGGACGSGQVLQGVAPSSKAAAAAAAGPELLGVRAADASRMSSTEWGDLVAAAAASAADAAALPPSLAAAATTAAAEAALAASSSSPTGTSSASSSAGNHAGYLVQLAFALAAARGLLQHTAVALYLLPSATGRRHLQQLASSIQRRTEQLEPLLLALPEREVVQQQQQQQSSQQQGQGQRAAGHQQAAATRGGASGGGGGGGGVTGWLLRRWYGVDPVPAAAAAAAAGAGCTPWQHPAVAALSGVVLLQQLQFAAAVHQRRDVVQAALQGLQADLRAMHTAARAGLYA